ncbi:MAG: malate dehydrogenase [Desulfobacteraceae bacterium 4484_190.3]|nr:MAG: malate dehydrogenase [Desulfobacteraceae bacterium 4484_190.3]
MSELNIGLDDLGKVFPANFTKAQVAKAQTLFLKELAYDAHKFYAGKMMTVPKCGYYGYNWFNVWYTPGVSKVSTTIRDDNLTSYDLTNRGNFVAVVSDSTRVLGDGDCTPPGGLGVMEGKAFLMKYLGGIDAVALCVDSKNEKGEHDPDKIIDFVKMVQPSFGAVNLEDISQPNCFKVLDELQDCDIPVWHDDAQGTACVTLAGLINALKLVDKPIGDINMAFFGAGAANTTICRLIMAAGADPENIIMCDSKGGLHKDREDLKADPRFYRKWEICEATNPKKVDNIVDAMKGADVLIAVSTPGPGIIKPEWVSTMADKSIVFACSNPVPEIYPYEARDAGAYVVATGRGDFPNQVNNSLGFPGILKGSLLVRATKVTDTMAIAGAHAIAKTAEDRGIGPDNITPLMTETQVYPTVASAVAMQAMEDGVARIKLTAKEVYKKTEDGIKESRTIIDSMMKEGFIKAPPVSLLENALKRALEQVD